MIEQIDEIYNSINDKLLKIHMSMDITSLNKINDSIDNILLNSKEVKTYEKGVYFDLFFNDNIIYYHPTSRIFFIYNDNNFEIYNEDYIISFIIRYINKFKIHDTIIKHSLKNNILKKIKTYYHVNDNVPNSETIQYILNFFVPNIFKTKDEAKYFITIIGDIITRKNNNIYFVNNSMKKFINLISKSINVHFIVINLMSCFKLKYHEHSLSSCRIIKTSEFNCEYFSLNEQFFINLICVSLHYTKRYNSSDEFMNHIMMYSSNNDLHNQVYFLKENEKNDILNDFLKKTLNIIDNNVTEIDNTLSDNDIIVLWKKYCKDNTFGISYYIKYEELIGDLKNILSYDENNKVFINVTSNHIPKVKSFIEFWEKYFYFDEEEYFLEISEIMTIYCKYNDKKINKISENNIIEMLENYVENIDIIDNKYIQKYGCTLWNKKKQIDISLKNMNIKSLHKDLNIHKIYSDYCEKGTTKNEMKVSKKYFENYIEENYI